MEQLIQKQMGFTRFSPDFTALLRSCMAKDDAGRYALDRIQIDTGGVCATDGKRMFRYDYPLNNIESEVYYLTSDGFALPDKDGRFPAKVNEVFPSEGETAMIYEDKSPTLNMHTEDLIVYHLNLAKVAMDVAWVLDIITRLIKLDAYSISAHVYKKTTEHRPFVIRGRFNKGTFRYIQMHINKGE